MGKPFHFHVQCQLHNHDVLVVADEQSEALLARCSNRSAAYLQLKDVARAWQDAEMCVKLHPGWEKGYFRLGSALEQSDMEKVGVLVVFRCDWKIAKGEAAISVFEFRTVKRLAAT